MIESLDYKWILGGLAGLISVCNVFFYLVSVVRGKTKPHVYTWLIWGMVSVVVLIAQIIDGAGAGSIFMMTATFNCFMIALFAHFKGTKDITVSDKICLIVCLVAIALWPITKIPLLSVLIVTFVDLVGYIPTIRKSYNKPQEENIITFSIFIFTSVLSILALENFSMLTAFYLIAITSANVLMVVMLGVRRRQLGHKVLA